MGIAFVTLHPRLLERIASEFSKLIHVIETAPADMGCVRAQVKSKLIPRGRPTDMFLSIEDGRLTFTQQPAQETAEELLALGHA